MEYNIKMCKMRGFLFIAVLGCLFGLVLPVSANQLGGHDSPYLAMHGDDPVAWQDWSADVLTQAKKQNKLLFVSIGDT